jgi:hypothetical protein
MKSRETGTIPLSNNQPETQDSTDPLQDNGTKQGTQLQTQKAGADAEALKAFLKYRAEHPEKLVVIDEMPHRPLNIDMREYSKK